MFNNVLNMWYNHSILERMRRFQILLKLIQRIEDLLAELTKCCERELFTYRAIMICLLKVFIFLAFSLKVTASPSSKYYCGYKDGDEKYTRGICVWHEVYNGTITDHNICANLKYHKYPEFWYADCLEISLDERFKSIYYAGISAHYVNVSKEYWGNQKFLNTITKTSPTSTIFTSSHTLTFIKTMTFHSLIVNVDSKEKALQRVVALTGPVSAIIDSSHFGFKFYKHGVYYDDNSDYSDKWNFLNCCGNDCAKHSTISESSKSVLLKLSLKLPLKIQGY
jgi:hypothetical protein